MKKLIIVIVVLVALGLVAPFFIGNQAETEFRKLYADMNLGPDLSFEVTEYNKGWFSSTATVAAVVNMGMVDPAQSERFTTYFNHKIQHGPLLTQTKALGLGVLDVSMTIDAPAEISSEYPEFNEILNKVVSFSGRVGMDGSVLTVVNINEYEFTEDGATVSLKSGAVNFTVADNQNLVGDGTWEGISMVSDTKEEMHIGPMKFAADMQTLGDQPLAMNGLFTGTSSASIDEFKFQGTNPLESATAKNIVMTSASDIEGEAMSVVVDLTIDEINAMGMTFTNFVFDQAVNSLNVIALQKVNNLSNQMNSDQISEADMQALQAAVMELLQDRPEILINKFGITTAQGDITSAARISVNPDLIDPNNPMTLMTAIEMTADGAISEAFLQSMGVMPMLNNFVTEGLLVVEDGAVKFDMVFEGGQMMLSGKPYSWARLLN